MSENDISLLAANTDLLLMDVDGVLTDGKLLFIQLSDDNIVETKMFDACDGAAVGFARRAGIKTGIISGRSSPVVIRRAEELGMDFIYHGLGRNKLPAFAEILERSGLPPSRICYVGDDIQDLPILTRVGFPVGVRNARPEVLAHVAYVTAASGGSGAVREVVELILRSQGKWSGVIDEFL